MIVNALLQQLRAIIGGWVAPKRLACSRAWAGTACLSPCSTRRRWGTRPGGQSTVGFDPAASSVFSGTDRGMPAGRGRAPRPPGCWGCHNKPAASREACSTFQAWSFRAFSVRAGFYP